MFKYIHKHTKKNKKDIRVDRDEISSVFLELIVEAVY